MSYLDEKYSKSNLVYVRISNERYSEHRLHPQKYYDERRERDRQIEQFEDVACGGGRANASYARERDDSSHARERDDSSYARERDQLLTRDIDTHPVGERDPILIRERDLNRYYRFRENEYSREEKHFPGPDHRFLAPRSPAPSMPYYPRPHPHPHRALLPTPVIRPPFYRNHPPRRRHHLDDIFLPNHDDEEVPEQERWRSPHYSYRPPVRVDVRTARPSEINESTQSGVYDCIKSAKNNDKPCDVSKSVVRTVNETKNETKTNNNENFSIHKRSETIIKEPVKNIEIEARNDKRISIPKNSETINKEVDLSKTPVQSTKKAKNDSCHIELKINEIQTKTSFCLSGNTYHQDNKKTEGPKNNKNVAKGKINIKDAPYSINIQTTCKVTNIVSVDLTREGDKKQCLTKATSQVDKYISKPTNDSSKSENKMTCSIKNLPSKHVSKRRTSLEEKGKIKNITDKKSLDLSNQITSESKSSISNKTVKSYSDDVVNKDKEKLQNKDNTTEKVTQQISNNKKSQQNVMDKNNDKSEDFQKNDTLTRNKDSDNKSTNSIDNQVENKTLTGTKEKTDRDLTIDIVRELEALVNQPADYTLTENKRSEKHETRKEQRTNDTNQPADYTLTENKRSEKHETGKEQRTNDTNQPADYTLTENKRSKKNETGKEQGPNDTGHNSTEQTNASEKGNLTQDTTSTSVPSSPQAVKKDIRMKLIRSPLQKSPLATDKSNKSGESNTNSKSCNESPNETSSYTYAKSDNSTSTPTKPVITKRSDNSHVSEKLPDDPSALNKFTTVNILQPKSAIRINTDNINGNVCKNSPILEDIFILEDAIQNIDDCPEVIEVPSSPPKKHTNTGDKETSEDCEIIELCSTPKRDGSNRFGYKKIGSPDVQIIEEKHDTVEIVDDDDDLSSTAINEIPSIPTIAVDVIKIESPDSCERDSETPTARPPEDFANLDTRGSFLWTFHQRFDDPRVVDMDISHSPLSVDGITVSEEPGRSEQQKETDRVIKNMDALWNEISTDKVDESNKSSKAPENVELKNNKIDEKEIVLTNQRDIKKVDNCKQSEEFKNVALKQNKYSDITPTKQDFAVYFLPVNIGTVTLGKECIISRSGSFSHKMNLNSFKSPLRKTKSLNDIASANKSHSCFSTSPVARRVTRVLKNIFLDKSSTNRLSENSISESNICLKSSTEDPKLSTSGHKDHIGNAMNHSDKESALNADYGISKKVDQMSKTTSNKSNNVDGDTAANDPDSSAYIDDMNHRKGNDIREIKRKRVRRIESSDEESTKETSMVIKKDNKGLPKQKKQKLQEKPIRKRKVPLDDKRKKKKPRKDVGVLNTLTVNEETKKDSSATNIISILPNKTINHLTPEVVTLSGVQTSTKYVTKAEYVKTFSQIKSPVPSISLSIEPVPKTQSIKRRRTTFTCEADNSTILKRFDSGERCKQKFLDLFGSVSDDEEDLIQVPSTDAPKTLFKGDKREEERQITSGRRNSSDICTLKKGKTGKKRKKSYISKPFIEEGNISDSSQFNSESTPSSNRNSVRTSKTLKHPKKHKVPCDKEDDNCKTLKNQTETLVQIKKKLTDEIPIPQSKDINLGMIKNPGKDTTSSKLKRQKSYERPEKKNVRDMNNKKLDLSNRRESTSSTDSRSRDGAEKKVSEKTRRVSRSGSKESDSSAISDVEKHFSKSDNTKEKKGKACKERHSKKEFSTTLKSEKPKKNCSSDRRNSTSSNESNISGYNQKKEAIPKNQLRKIEHQRKSVSKQRNIDETNKESNEEGTNIVCKETIGSEVALKIQLPIKESMKKNDSFHTGNQKSELLTINADDIKEILKETSNKGKAHSVETSNSFKKKAARSSKDNSSTEHTAHAFELSGENGVTVVSRQDRKSSKHNKCVKKIEEQSKLAGKELKVTGKDAKRTADSVKTIKESVGKKSAPDILSKSHETSLIIGQIGNFPLLYRSSENEINETFQTCQAYTPHVVKYNKITRMTIIDIECVDRVHVSDPPEIHTGTKTIKQIGQEDDDVIEIRPIISVVDLTEEDTRISSESAPKDTLSDLILVAKKELAELAQDQSTITLYRSEEGNINPDEEVQAMADTIQLGSTNSYIKKDTDLPKQDTVISSAEVRLADFSNKNKSSNKKRTDFDNNLNQKIPDAANETASPAASHLFSNLAQNLEIGAARHDDNTPFENSITKSGNIETTVTAQAFATRVSPSSLEDENQRAVSSILDIRQNNQHLSVSTNSLTEVEGTTNQDAINLQPILGTITLQKTTVNDNLHVEANQLEQSTSRSNLQQTIETNHHGQSYPVVEKVNHPENSLKTAECHKGSESHELNQTSLVDVTQKNKRPSIVVGPTSTKNNADTFNCPDNLNLRLGAAQDKIVQDLSGQHKGLPQTLRDCRPIPRGKTAGIVVPPALVNITRMFSQTNNQTVPQKLVVHTNENNGAENNQTGPQNPVANTAPTNVVDSCQISIQNSRATENHHSSIDLTDDNENLSFVSTMDMRLIVEIFTRHVFFLAHLCKAQNGYIDYLKQQTFCQHYFRAEIAMFEDQKQTRLLSQSLRLVSELQNLNIRATRNLSNSASEIVERITVNLANRDMPKQVTKSMVYLLIAQLIKPRLELFGGIPLLKALIRLCDVVVCRMFAKYPGSLTESQRKILTRQVQEYNKLFAGQLNSQIAPSSDYSGQPTVETNYSAPIARLTQQFGLPLQSGATTNLSRGPPNVIVRPDNSIQAGSSSLMYQASVGPNLMSPPNWNVPIQRHRFASPRQSSAYVLPNNSRKTRGSVRPTRDLPGGANTNTLGSTPRYLPNYATPNRNHVYSSLGRPQQQPNNIAISDNINPLNTNLPPPNLNSKGLRGVLPNQNNLTLHSHNPLLSKLLNNNKTPDLRHCPEQQSPQQTSVSQSPCYNSSHNNVSTGNPLHNVSQSPRHNVVFQSPRNPALSQTPLQERSFGPPPSYEDSIGTLGGNTTYTSSCSPPNQLPPEEAKKRSENLLNELLFTPDNGPLFGRPASPTNDNFRIKLPFTQPDITSSTTVHTTSANTSSTFNDKAPNASLSTVQSNVCISSTTIATTSSQLSNNNTAQPVVLVNNLAATTSFVVVQPQRTVVLNQGLAALSSIGPPLAMLNSSFQQTQNSHSTTNVELCSTMANQPLVHGNDALQTASPTVVINNSNVPQSQSRSEEITCNQNSTKVAIQPLPSYTSDSNLPNSGNGPLNKAVTNIGKGKTSDGPSAKFKVVSKRTSRKQKTIANVSKPKSKTKTRPKQRRSPAKRKNSVLSKPVEIVDLVSSDDDMPLENQASEDERISGAPESDNVKTTEALLQVEVSKVNAESTEQHVTGNKTVDLSPSSSTQAPLDEASSTSDVQNQDPQVASEKTLSTRAQIEDSQPSTSKTPTQLEATNEEDDIVTIDLTWIDDMDDQELRREMDFVFIKKEEPRDDDEQDRNNMAVPSPADSGISSPPVQGEDDTTVYTVNVQRLCICSATAQYNCICGEAWYCGQECQLKDWESHQKVCQIGHETIGTEEFMLNEPDNDNIDQT